VLYVDSLRPHQSLSQYVIRQLLQLFRGKVDDNGKLQVNLVPSTPQPSRYDCSVYAVAYATELALNNAPARQAPFYTQQMRGHLERCLESGELEQFPRMTPDSMGDNARLPDSPMATLVLKCCSDCVL